MHWRFRVSLAYPSPTTPSVFLVPSGAHSVLAVAWTYDTACKLGQESLLSQVSFCQKMLVFLEVLTRHCARVEHVVAPSCVPRIQVAVCACSHHRSTTSHCDGLHLIKDLMIGAHIAMSCAARPFVADSLSVATTLLKVIFQAKVAVLLCSTAVCHLSHPCSGLSGQHKQTQTLHASSILYTVDRCHHSGLKKCGSSFRDSDTAFNLCSCNMPCR